MPGKKRKPIEPDAAESSPAAVMKAAKRKSLTTSKAVLARQRAQSEPAGGHADLGADTPAAAAAPSTELKPGGRARKKKRSPLAEASEQEPAAAGTAGKKRRKTEAAGEQADEPAAGENGEPRPKKRRRRSRQHAPEQDLPEEERQRRQRQRQLRELALKVRAEGKKYRQPRKRSTAVKEKAAERPAAKAGKDKGSGKARKEGGPQAKKQREETGTRPEGSVEVIVVPIFWNRKPQEKERVLEAAAAVERLLAGAGVAAGTDTTNALSPGQKFAFWEHRGVLVRIECGPKEADRGQCVLALTATAGSVAQKRTFQVGPNLLQAVGQALGRDLKSGTAPGEAVAETAGPRPEQPMAKRPAAVSGDDVGGDFAGLELAGDEPKKGKKKRRK